VAALAILPGGDVVRVFEILRIDRTLGVRRPDDRWSKIGSADTSGDLAWSRSDGRSASSSTPPLARAAFGRRPQPPTERFSRSLPRQQAQVVTDSVTRAKVALTASG